MWSGTPIVILALASPLLASELNLDYDMLEWGSFYVDENSECYFSDVHYLYDLFDEDGFPVSYANHKEVVAKLQEKARDSLLPVVEDEEKRKRIEVAIRCLKDIVPVSIIYQAFADAKVEFPEPFKVHKCELHDLALIDEWSDDIYSGNLTRLIDLFISTTEQTAESVAEGLLKNEELWEYYSLVPICFKAAFNKFSGANVPAVSKSQVELLECIKKGCEAHNCYQPSPFFKGDKYGYVDDAFERVLALSTPQAIQRYRDEWGNETMGEVSARIVKRVDTDEVEIVKLGIAISGCLNKVIGADTCA